MKFLYYIKAILLTYFLSSFSNLSFAIDAERYVIDSTHSSVEFSIRHFVAKTNGNFSTFEGFIDIDTNDPTKNYTEAQISIKSVNTNSTKRDAHLQEADYFNSSSNPLIEFKSTNWAKNQANDTFLVEGILTMNGVSKTVTLDVTLLGLGKGFNGQKLSGWEGTTTLNRTDWNILGGLGAVGEMVDIRINLEAYKK
jgi:polyisoprenoid-binding protein YceI